MGKPVAGAGFAYSDALKGIGGNWGWSNMSDWLQSPRRFADGTKMTFAGLGKIEDRANLMAYMNAQGSNIPLPEAPAEEVAEEATEEAEETAEADASGEAVAEETAEAGEAATEE